MLSQIPTSESEARMVLEDLRIQRGMDDSRSCLQVYRQSDHDIPACETYDAPTSTHMLQVANMVGNVVAPRSLYFVSAEQIGQVY